VVSWRWSRGLHPTAVIASSHEALYSIASSARASSVGGVVRPSAFERKWRECGLPQIAPISTNLILAYIGQHVLGMPRSY
jgi:acyl-CoA dehydrogenase